MRDRVAVAQRRSKRPPRCFHAQGQPNRALNPLSGSTVAALSVGSKAILYFTRSEPLTFNLIEHRTHLPKNRQWEFVGGIADESPFYPSLRLARRFERERQSCDLDHSVRGTTRVAGGWASANSPHAPRPCVAGGELEGACPGHNTVYHSRSFVRVCLWRRWSSQFADRAFPDHIGIEAEGYARRTPRIAPVSRRLGNGQRSLAPRLTQNGDESARLPDWSRSFPTLADRRADLPAA